MERPILYSTIMVQALLDNRKKQTRRTNKLEVVNQEPNNWIKPSLDSSGEWVFSTEKGPAKQVRVKCPYGKLGDLLWVRETFCPTGSQEYLNASTEQPYFYKADVKESDFVKEMMANYGWKWKPSIHMPKDAARIWLKVTNVRVERLQEISKEDAIAEGIEKAGEVFKFYMNPKPNYWKPAVDNPIISFHSLWECINGENSWIANPWVWVVEFEVVSTTGRANVKEVKA